MDIKTNRGKKTVEEEKFMLNEFENAWSCKAIHTPLDMGSACDGFFVRDNEIKALFESKCRKLTLSQLEEYGSWLISYDKINKCKQLSTLLCVPFFGLLYLLDENLIMYWKITDETGEYLFDINSNYRKTQRCVNGGEKIDNVALIPINKGLFLQ